MIISHSICHQKSLDLFLMVLLDFFYLIQIDRVERYHLNFKHMNILEKVRAFLSFFDLISFVPLLRYKYRNDEYKTAFGGLVLLLMGCAAFAVFHNIIKDTFNRNIIHYKLTEKSPQVPTKTTIPINESFTFFLMVPGIDPMSPTRYFDFEFIVKNVSLNKRPETVSIPFVPCVSVMEKLTPYFNKTSSNNLQEMLKTALCPQMGHKIHLQGRKYSDVFTYGRIAIKKCNKESNQNSTCASKQALDTFWMAKKNTFQVNFYFINTVINAGDKIPVSYEIDASNYFVVNLNECVSANLLFHDYSITTDQSIWLNEDLQTVLGVTVKQSATEKRLPIEVQKDEYFKLYLRQAERDQFYYRSFPKVLDSFTYFWGIFMLIILVFHTIASKYNTYVQEIELADVPQPNRNDAVQL